MSSWPVIRLVDNPAYTACIGSNLTASQCGALYSPYEAVADHPYGAYALVILLLGLALIVWSVVQRIRKDQEWPRGKRHWAVLILGGVVLLWMALTIQGIGFVGSSFNQASSDITVSDPYFIRSAITGIILGVVGLVMLFAGSIGTIESFFPREN